MKVTRLKAAYFENPARFAFALSRFQMLRLAFNAVRSAIKADPGIVILTGNLELFRNPDLKFCAESNCENEVDIAGARCAKCIALLSGRDTAKGTSNG